MRRLAVTLAVLAVAGVAAAPASALTKSQATRAALEALKPDKAKADDVVVFGLPKALGARTTVAEAGTPGSKSRVTVRNARLGRKAWLFWEDLAYGRKFEHPSRLVLVDDRTGRVFRNRAMRWWPLVGGRDAAFIAKRGAGDRKFRVYKRIKHAQIESPPVVNAAFASPLRAFASALPPGKLADSCIVFMVDKKGYGGDFKNMKDYWTKAGIPAERMFTDVPTKNEGGIPNGIDLQNFIPKLPANCKDVVLYVNGHSSGSGVTTVGQTSYEKKDGSIGKQDQKVGPGHIVKVLKGNPARTFKIIWDACYSGTVADQVQKEKPTNLLVMITAAGMDQYAIGFGTSAFTTGLINGMKKAEDDVALDQSGADPTARLIEMGHAKSTDWAAGLGLTDPVRVVNLPPYTVVAPPAPPPPSNEPAPTIGKIQATLAAPVTQYQVTVNALPGRGIDYAWSLKPPDDDPTCNNFKQLAAPRYAEWRHSDADGCHHTGTDHAGVVTVVATVHWPDQHKDWVCTATYNGSESGFGPEPGPCQAKTV